nr:nitrogen fixation protein NifQ [Oceanobacter mangrovi]
MQIQRSQRRGITSLPHFLGLKPAEFHWMSRGRHYRISHELAHDQQADQQLMADDLRQQLLQMREDEWLELRNLMLSHRAGVCDSEVVMADIVAAACLGGTHLWKDLGMSDRQQLNLLLSRNFPSLASRNDRDMKWKKFFYKQLCELGGGYVCRAPSCDVCSAYSDCFGPED